MSISRFRSSLFLIIFFVVLLAQVFLPISQSSAVSGDGVSWSDPTFYKSEQSSGPEDTMCKSSYKMVVIANQTQPKSTCVISGRNVSFGFYAEASNYIYVVGFENDSKMYPLQISGMSNIVSYSASQDVLIMKQAVFRPYMVFESLVLYKDFSKILVRSNDFIISSAYTISKSEPDYTCAPDGGSPYLMKWPRMSDNGNWIVFEANFSGIIVLDIEKLETRFISVNSFVYGQGMDPFFELAVSNDGKYVAMFGLNVDPSIVKIDSSCGDLTINPCEVTRVNEIASIPAFLYGWSPKFNEDGSELRFTGLYDSVLWRSIVLRVKGYIAPKIDYIALGDSYSSGEGELQDVNYLDGTNVEYEKCHVSNRSYAFRLSYTLGLNPRFTKNVACSGAVVEDVVGDDGSYWGQGNRLSKIVINKDKTEKTRLQLAAIDNFLPGRVHQEAFVKKYQPGVITVGIGGNDVGFAAKLTACLGPGTCSWADYSVAKEKAAIEIKNLFNALVDAYQKIHIASPYSKIYAVGYPKLIDPDGQCGALTGFLLNEKERIFLDEGVIYLNQVISAAAKKVGIKYIDVESSLGDHVLCGGSQDSAINSIKLGDDIGPVEESKWFRFIGQESFHPNALGHQLVSEAISRQVENNIITYSYCPGAILCPQDVTVPNPSYYWTAGMIHNYPAQKIANFVTDSVNLADYIHKRLALAINSLAPNSFVGIEITSTPQSLGIFPVSADGSFNADIELPSDLEEGYHTIHLYGRSYAGEQIELYQVIRYVKPFVEEVKTPVTGPAVDKINETIDDMVKKIDEAVKTKPAENNNVVANFSLSNSISGVGELNWLSVDKTNNPESTSDVASGKEHGVLFSILIVAVCVITTSMIICIIIHLFEKK